MTRPPSPTAAAAKIASTSLPLAHERRRTNSGSNTSNSSIKTPASGPVHSELSRSQRRPGSGSNTLRPTALQPRLAVVLNVPPRWHLWLFALRLVSILPAVWWGLPAAPHFVVLACLPGWSEVRLVVEGADGGRREALTEMGLATIWCASSGYLSFFFTDCLMSRWLINYTPQATVVRLLSINTVNAYVTLTVLSLSGGFNDPRLLLPGWIGIATTLTVLYHITHQKINIRKETSTSVNIFSFASFLSMVVLLAHMHAWQPHYPQMPLAVFMRNAYNNATNFINELSPPLPATVS